jgi:hypothetical protein
MRQLFLRPFLDVFRGEARCLRRPLDLAALAAGLAAGWWVTVPIHELLHAAGCLAAGGTVSRLEIAPLYGAGLLARLLPWVVAGGEYAGRLSGFDTGGSDLVYLATDLAPFLLTLFPGVWLLRRAARAGRPLLFGAVAPLALAPFLSLTGDAYEIGSILVTRLPPWSSAGVRDLLRGDDLLARAAALAAQADLLPWLGLALATVAGTLWAFATYAAAGGLATRLGQPPLTD